MPDIIVFLLVQVFTSSNGLNLTCGFVHLKLIIQQIRVFGTLLRKEDIIFMGPEQVVVEHRLVDGSA